MKIFSRCLFSRKWFFDHKKFSTNKFWWKFFVWTCFRGNDFAPIKILWIFLVQICFCEYHFAPKKILMKNFGSMLFPKYSFCAKKFDEHFWYKPVFDEIILHQKKFWQNILMNFFGSNQFSRYSFCTQKRFWWKFLV